MKKWVSSNNDSTKSYTIAPKASRLLRETIDNFIIQNIQHTISAKVVQNHIDKDKIQHNKKAPSQSESKEHQSTVSVNDTKKENKKRDVQQPDKSESHSSQHIMNPVFYVGNQKFNVNSI